MRGALVPGDMACALRRASNIRNAKLHRRPELIAAGQGGIKVLQVMARSEERRLGKECTARWQPKDANAKRTADGGLARLRHCDQRSAGPERSNVRCRRGS